MKQQTKNLLIAAFLCLGASAVVYGNVAFVPGDYDCVNHNKVHVDYAGTSDQGFYVKINKGERLFVSRNKISGVYVGIQAGNITAINKGFTTTFKHNEFEYQCTKENGSGIWSVLGI